MNISFRYQIYQNHDQMHTLMQHHTQEFLYLYLKRTPNHISINDKTVTIYIDTVLDYETTDRINKLYLWNGDYMIFDDDHNLLASLVEILFETVIDDIKEPE